MVKRKREFPLWFKIETIIFLIFSVAVGVSYFDRVKDLNGIEGYYLFIKFSALLSLVVLVWLISFIFCRCKR